MMVISGKYGISDIFHIIFNHACFLDSARPSQPGEGSRVFPYQKGVLRHACPLRFHVTGKRWPRLHVPQISE